MRFQPALSLRDASIACLPVAMIFILAFAPPAVGEDPKADEAKSEETAAETPAGWPHRWVTSLASGTDRVYAGVADGLLLRESSVVAFSAGDPSSSETLYSHPVSVWAVAVAPDGSSVASTDYKGNLTIYKLADKQQTMKEAVFERWARALAFTPDGANLVAANEAGKVFVYDVAKGEVSQSVELDGQQIYSVAISPDGQSLAAGDGAGSVHLLKLPSLETIKKVACSDSPVWSVCFSADGKGVFAGGADQQLQRLSVQDEAEPKVLGKASDWITVIVRAPGTSEIAIGSMDGSMFTTNGNSFDPVGKTPSGIWSIAYADGALLAATRKHMVATFVPSWKVGYIAADESK